jgi:NAD(P)-dependent dehydrogenase (short-subunit alcohol dehydrogenase family)
MQKLSAELGIEHAIVNAVRLDEVDTFFSDLQQRACPIAGVANCAGSLLLKPAHQTSEEEYAETIAANLTTAFAVVRASAKAMMKSGGSIVLVSSAAARQGLSNHEAIAAAKAGVIGLTLSAAATYASYRIRVNCVAPGLVRTPLTQRLTSNETSLRASVAMHPLQRIGEPADVASAIAWLLDPRNEWVTGQILGIDGGLATVRSKR